MWLKIRADYPQIVIFLIFSFFFFASLFLNLPAIHNGFLCADQAVYLAMTQSIALDGDLEYTTKDLARYYYSFEAGPQGIFLKKGKDGRIFYAKSFAYSLFAAPFVRLFGVNGFLVFHSFLLFLIIYMGTRYLSLTNNQGLSLAATLTFLFASIAGVYYFWISPDFFNLSLIFFILFLWLYKIQAKKSQKMSFSSGVERFILSNKTDYLASLLLGFATFSKPPNAVLLGPLFLYQLLQRRIGRALLMALIFVGSVALFFGANYLLTSDWNYMGGERKTFIGTFPLEKENITFDSIGHPMTSEGYFEKFFLPLTFVPINLFYYFFGRFTGITWYFFPALLALILFLLRKKTQEQWMLLLGALGGILTYVIFMPDNYGGGGGSLANRYFLNIYPLFFFLVPQIKKKGEIFLCWLMAAFFISPILVSPFHSSAQPATHAKRFPFKALPVEMTLINNLPTNTNPRAFRVDAGLTEYRGFLHFLDDNFLPKLEPTGIWTRGPYPCEMILKTYYPLKEIVVHLLNNPRRNNQIKVTVEGKTQQVTLQSKQRATLRFPVGRGFQIKASHLYRIKIKASKGSIPYFESPTSDERRVLGVFFELELIPAQ
ncbi:MAG: hypothetical protein N3B16_00295 [Candidatus Aminicenantes bacterium]|nr:hypothetical protein [Candidatus Aminicenantes bacterium]